MSLGQHKYFVDGDDLLKLSDDLARDAEHGYYWDFND
jgi:hypothetical protein